ncbi:MAG: trypsin-like peptidase domain-containing protein [Pseudomonadota bacterium]|nr:trypsin-like peptidase domain-containing protein [Pseudomonadota bacterium]
MLRSLLLVALVAACTASADSPRDPPGSAPAGPPPPAVPTAATTPVPGAPTPLVPPPGPSARIEDEQNTIDVFRAAAPGTVYVAQTQVVVDYWNRRTMEVPAGSGTGFLWDRDGHVVTNYHVVDGGKSYTVTLYDQTEWPAKLVGGDKRKDVAVLKIDAPPEKLIPLRLPPEGYTPEVGQKALAIGNPFGLDHTLTTGVVSALDREMVGFGAVTIRGMVQTDASINPGNSGGPLIDSAGQLIGMNTMIYSKSGSSAGIGFAVPVATVRRVVDQVIATGKVELIGIGVRLVDPRTAQRIGVKGAAVLEVLPDSPAAKAGLRGVVRTERGVRLGDVITRIGDDTIANYDDLYTALDGRKAGDEVKVTFTRDGKEMATTVAVVVIDEGS